MLTLLSRRNDIEIVLTSSSSRDNDDVVDVLRRQVDGGVYDASSWNNIVVTLTRTTTRWW